MLAPIDKLKAGGNNIVQIVLTRKCDLFTCSDCSQLLPFRKDALEMSLECVEEALVSMAGWPGVVSCFGGNPISHSRFADICKLWQKYLPDQKQRGLWTNNLLRHGAICRETFWPHGRFNLNVHGSTEAAAEMRKWLPGIPVYGETGRNHHAAMLLDYRDYGISEGQWIAYRENCDIGRKWSSGVYQGPDGRPYAYFCEVGGSLSGIRGENNGMLCESGWWKRPMSDFASQVETCCNRGCGVPLRGRGHQDADAVYDISLSWEKLTAKHTGKIEVEVHTERPEAVHENTDYLGSRIKKGK